MRWRAQLRLPFRFDEPPHGPVAAGETDTDVEQNAVKQLACLICLIALIAVAPPGLMGAGAAAKDAARDTVQQTPSLPGPKKETPAQAQGGTKGPQAPGRNSSASPETSEERMPAGPALDKLSTSLKQIESSLGSHDLTEAELQELRQQVGPISGEVAGVIDRLTPALAAIKARLDELGPSPEPDTEAPPESPEVTAERARQQKLYNDIGERLKRARLLAVEADQTGQRITARQRALFARSLFARAMSIANPALWASVWDELPGDAAAVESIFGDWVEGIDNRLQGHQRLVFWGGLALIIFLYVLISLLARRVLARNPSVAEPTRLLKVLGAWWVALVVALPAVAMVFAVGLLLQAFDHTNAKLEPFIQASGGAVIRIALAAGIARGLFAPTRPNWRLPKLSDPLAAGLVRAAVGLACVVSAIRLLMALSDIIGTSLPVAVAMRELAVIIGAAILGFQLWHFGASASADESRGPETEGQKGRFEALRIAAWLVIFAAAAAILAGYAAFGSFLIDQIFWDGLVGWLLFMSIVLADEAIGAGFSPATRFGRRLAASTGIRRNSLELTGILVSGIIRLALFILALALVVAPWGLQSTEVLSDFSAALFGFKVDGVTISLSSVFIAIGIFALTFAAVHGVVQWLDVKLFPKTSLDLGLRNSIRTSLGYLGFVIAALLALSYLGVSFEKLAIVAGALSVGIGFGLQSIVNNFVSGLILLWERAIRAGDWIVVGSDQGYVRRINVRSTEIETFDRSQVIIPNSNLMTGVVVNLVRNDRTGRIIIPITVAGAADPQRVREVLTAIAKSHELVLKIPPPQVLFTGMSASSLNFELRAFVTDVETMIRVKSDLHFEIFKRFKEEKFFEIPGPDTTKVEIVGAESLGRLLKLGSEIPALDQLKRDAAAR